MTIVIQTVVQGWYYLSRAQIIFFSYLYFVMLDMTFTWHDICMTWHLHDMTFRDREKVWMDPLHFNSEMQEPTDSAETVWRATTTQKLWCCFSMVSCGCEKYRHHVTGSYINVTNQHSWADTGSCFVICCTLLRNHKPISGWLNGLKFVYTVYDGWQFSDAVVRVTISAPKCLVSGNDICRTTTTRGCRKMD